jgi:hypothetical protein
LWFVVCAEHFPKKKLIYNNRRPPATPLDPLDPIITHPHPHLPPRLARLLSPSFPMRARASPSPCTHWVPIIVIKLDSIHMLLQCNSPDCYIHSRRYAPLPSQDGCRPYYEPCSSMWTPPLQSVKSKAPDFFSLRFAWPYLQSVAASSLVTYSAAV